MKTFTQILSVCLLMASSLTVQAQVDLNFTSSADIESDWTFTAPNAPTGTPTVTASIESSDYLSLKRNGFQSTFPSAASNPAKAVLSALYQPAGGIVFGADRFIAVKSSSSIVALNLLSNEVGSAVATCAYTIPVSPVPGTKFYIHLYRLSEFTGTPTNLTPSGNLNCTSMEIIVPTNATVGASSTNTMSEGRNTVYFDWVRTFSTEEAMTQYALDNSKLNIDFNATDVINASSFFWIADGSNNDAPNFTTNTEYMSFTTKSTLTTYPVTTAVRYNSSYNVPGVAPTLSVNAGGFDWDLTNAKVVVVKMEVIGATAIPQFSVYANNTLMPGSVKIDATYSPEANPQAVPNSSDKLYVFQFPSTLTAFTGKQRFSSVKIKATLQNAGDVAKVDWVKVFPSLDAANAYVNGLTPIPEIQAPKTTLKLFRNGNGLSIDGLSTPELVDIYTIAGTKVYSKISSNGIIPFLPKGVYVVKCKNDIVKVIL